MGVVDDGYYGDQTGLDTYVWTNQCTYMTGTDNSNYPYAYTGEFSWMESYVPDCENTQRNHNLGYNSVSVSFEYETIDWNYARGGWIGGSSDSTLEIYVNNIEPNWQYRLIIYFEMASSINNLE